MNTLRNSVRLYGNVGKEPEVKTFDNGNKVATFSLATSEKCKEEIMKDIPSCHDGRFENYLKFGLKKIQL